MITALPQSIIEIILCLLPIQHAAKTSILSREWRYKWTKIPKLEFSDSTVNKSSEEIDYEQKSGKRICKSYLDSPTQSEQIFDITCDLVYALRRSKLFYVINQVLLQHEGPILDFTLSMTTKDDLFEVDRIICHLSRNHPVKILRLDMMDDYASDGPYKVPLSLFSFHHLTDLYLEDCEIKHVPVFNGFGSLVRLTLKKVRISVEPLQRLLSNCPSLKSLTLVIDYDLGRSFFVMQLFKCLPMNIEDLHIKCDLISWVSQGSVPKESPTSLIYLKYLRIDDMRFDNKNTLIFLAVLIKCSPNLEKIDIQISEMSAKLEEYRVILEEYADVWLEHLIEFEIDDPRDKKPEFELEMVKFILARSPNLKQVFFKTYLSDKNEEFEMLKNLLRAPRASPVAEIVVHNFCDDR